MSESFLIKLYPIEPFFFGGEKTFSTPDETNYSIRSKYFPQQTGLLGLLRYHLLKTHGKLGENDSELIGPESFSAQSESQGFGKIKEISPIFLRLEKNGEPVKNFIPLSFDYGYNNKGEILPLTLQKDESIGRAFQSCEKNYLPRLKNYKAKNGIAHLYIEAGGNGYRHVDYDKTKAREEVNGIFIREPRVGISKSAKEEAFYRQEYLNLRPDYCFAFFAELEEEIGEDLVWIGKERTVFRLEIEKAGAASFKNIFTPNTFMWLHKERQGQVILISDTFVENKMYYNCDYAITETINFRNIRTPAKVNNYGALSQHKDSSGEYRFRSDKYTLLKRGSILYGDPAPITDHLNNDHFQSIGYNHYLSF